jgi:ribonuclease P protein component
MVVRSCVDAVSKDAGALPWGRAVTTKRGASVGDQRFTSSERLRCQREFQRVFQDGAKHVSPAFALYVLPTSASRSRLGMAVSKRVGGAVVRNRLKRCIREFFRRYKADIHPACDLVVVARREAADLSYAEITQHFLRLSRRYRRPQTSWDRPLCCTERAPKRER